MTEAYHDGLTARDFAEARLLAKDFDGTVALTFEKSPAGIGVHEAYEMTIEDMFGVKALEQYKRSGGLQNRQPAELVHDLAPEAEGVEFERLKEELTSKKLDVLMGEIGTTFPDGKIWPRPTNGYLAFKEQFEIARAEGALIDDLILSSGHEPFIEKTYRAWNVNRPGYIIAEETTNQLLLIGRTVEESVKPSPLLMVIGRASWRASYGIFDLPDLPEMAEEVKRIIYVGDDPVKDGQMAKNCGIEFVLLDPARSSKIWRDLASRFMPELVLGIKS